MRIYYKFLFMLLYTSVLFSQTDSTKESPGKIVDSLNHKPIHTDTIEVNSRYFKKDEKANTGFINTGYEELKKTPGTADDVIRYFQSSEGVSIGSDMANEYIVRGGAPHENMIMIDNIELPNPNHFGPPGTNSGALSYLNIQMINETNFYTGGFPVTYGDKLSSVLDINFRDGNEKKYHGSLDLSIGGLGITAEGPISKKLTYLLSARRSYFELFKEQFRDLPIPNYWDVNLKLNYKLSNNQTISLTSIAAIDNANNPDSTLPNQKKNIRIKLFTNGVNYFKEKHDVKFILTTFHNLSFYNVDYLASLATFNTALMYLDSRENELGLNAHLIYNFNKNITTDLISGIRYYNSKDTLFTSSWSNESNCYSPHEELNKTLNIIKCFAGINLNFKSSDEKLILNTGARIDYVNYLTNKLNVSPRAGLTYKLSKKTSLSGSVGIYRQTPEILWLLADEENRNLLSLKIYNYVLGVEHYIFPNIRINAEAYYKQYKNYPVDVYNPIFIYINSGMDILPNFIHKAVSSGNGYFTGLDLSLQYKNNGRGFYGKINFSFTKSAFAALEGGIQPAEFDYGKQALIIAGYQIPDEWAFGIRVKYSGSRPMVSFDSLNSAQTGTIYFNKERYLKDKLPYYMRVDLRIDKMFRFWNLNGSVYAEIENLFNKDNIFEYFWDETHNKSIAFYQWSILPVLGFNVKF